MEKNSDEKIYIEYLNGNNDALEKLYAMYKNKLVYFVNNIVKDYEKAEDIVQDTFIYVMEHKKKEEVSFKYYMYLVAKSKALNYINKENRRKEIVEQYFNSIEEVPEEELLEAISTLENKENVLSAIDELEEKYKNAIYLVYIEKMSYEQTAEILGQTLTNTKTLIHRGKNKLRTILLKKGLDNMNKVVKIFIIALLIMLCMTGAVFAGIKIYRLFNANHKITMNPTFESTIDKNTINNLWVGTLDLAWGELKDILGKEKIEFEENIDIVDSLNNSSFEKENLDKEDYVINVTKTDMNGYKIEAELNKTLTFIEAFDNLTDEEDKPFGKGTENVKWFGINNASKEKLNKNIEVLFYDEGDNENKEFAVKLQTQEGDEIILYKTKLDTSFDEIYNVMKQKAEQYKGSKKFTNDDEILIPYVKVNGLIKYNELYGKTIKDTNGLIMYDVVQKVNFYLNEKGCNLKSSLSMATEYLSAGNRYFYYTDTFVIFMSEGKTDKPYFALKVDDDNIIEKKEESNLPKIVDFTVVEPKSTTNIQKGEYKFFEDEKYEYYYESKKTKYVVVFFNNGDMITVEEALKNGKITISLLDDYGVEYIKKEKQIGKCGTIIK